MKEDGYRRYKECDPKETVLRIQEILGKLGLFPVYRWTGRSREGTYSNRIELYPCSRGTNGKGADKTYALASGYAELMERLENNVLLFRGGDVIKMAGFMEAPDEKEILPEVLLKDPDPFTFRIAKLLEEEPESSGLKALLEMLTFPDNGKRVIKGLPYADPEQNSITYLPIHLVRLFNGTNGMAAGNTLEEAMVQGLSELFEREVNRLVLQGKAAAPAIPDEELEQYGFYPVIAKLRAQKRYRIQILDYSLGRDWPVVAFCITDLEHGTFGIKFGAHPSFPVAVERTLTEAAQGSTFEEFALSCRIGSGQEVYADQNLFHIAKNGKGTYPVSLFTEKPGWKYRRWTRFQGKDNREFLSEYMQLLKDEGLRVLYRDVSFLGFPACHIVIPGFAPIHSVSGRKVRLRRTELNASGRLRQRSEMAVEDAVRLLNLIRFNEGSRIFSTVAALLGVPLRNPLLSDSNVGFLLSLGLGEYVLAEHFLDCMITDEARKEERSDLLCAKAYVEYRRKGIPALESATLIRSLYSEECSEKVLSQVLDPAGTLTNLLTRLNCPNCRKCVFHGDGCDYPEQEKMYQKISAEMKKAGIRQEPLLLLLRSVQENRSQSISHITTVNTTYNTKEEKDEI